MRDYSIAIAISAGGYACGNACYRHAHGIKIIGGEGRGILALPSSSSCDYLNNFLLVTCVCLIFEGRPWIIHEG